ncbi:AAA family ATPase [Tautonia sociabilis]|uniref:AAA family ATPase n=1 Tax=Tautonia sociabilis TaxID=2080755 RepID=UPI0018F6DAA1
MTDATVAAFVETREYRRFREFCDACRRYRYIGLCHGPPGVGKTLSARRYGDWDRVEATEPYADSGDFRCDDVPGNGCVFYTATVVNSPGQIQGGVFQLRQRMRELVRQAIRTESAPVIAAAQRRLEKARDDYLVKHDWFAGKPARLERAEAAVARAILDRAKRDHQAVDPTELLLVDEVDRIRMAGLEQLRAIFDDGGIGLVLIGMPGLERRLARYAQLYSRIGFIHEFRPLGAPEVRELLGGWRPPGATLPDDLLADAEAVATIIRITGGNFRLLDRLLTQVARILEINALDSVTREVVEAAREVLVIGAA